MFKNPTPRQVAFVAALLTTVCMVFAYLVSIYFFAQNMLVKLVVFAVLLFMTAYLVIHALIRRFLYRRIKLIYKNIHKSRRTKDEKLSLVDIDDNSINSVETEVESWVEKQAKELQHLKSLEEYRRNYLGNVSHELKTPIFNIQGYIHTLLDGGLYDENINLNYLGRAAKNAERLQVIVEDLDNISQFESGRLELDIQTFDIRELTQSVFEEQEYMAKEKGVSLMFKEGADRNYQVHADINTIRQVLVNLITNSIKYSIKDGTTKVSFYDMDKYILIEIADNGIGIPVKHLPYVFDRFYRADKSRSRDLGGSGLGLSIVKHIIEAHHQTINVRSSEGVGSTFGFTLEKANS